MNNLDIVEILKYAPKGLWLYSPVCGGCRYNGLTNGGFVEVSTSHRRYTFTRTGRLTCVTIGDDCECLLFPSKESTDWSKWAEVFSHDPVAYGCCIYMDETTPELITSGNHYCDDGSGGPIVNSGYFNDWAIRFASPDETNKFFETLRKKGFMWNNKTFQLEEANKPKHFAIAEFKAGQPVLVRNDNRGRWCYALYSHCEEHESYPFVTAGENCFIQCIPFERNESLVGTDKMCPEQYINW